MASRKLHVKKILIKKLPKLELDVYSNLSLSDLVVFALSYLEEREVIATTEEIVSICFRLFPYRFALKNYPRWPDSALVIRRLNDDREKKNIKGNPADGFALTFKGKQVAKRVAKALGLFKPVSKKKKKQQKTVAPLILTKKTLRKRVRKPIQKISVRKRLVKKPSKKVVKKPVQKVVKKPVPKAIKKPIKKSVKKVVTKKKPTLQKPQPKQLTLALTPVQVKKQPIVKSKQVNVKKEAAIPIKMEVVISPASVSKEEKVKAGKVMHLVEKSDAYRLYKKNGKQAKISEFDFRNMLFTTMESSSDTLSRNVALFKKYADIHSRNDVIMFLNFCENSFASLLKKKR